MMTPAERTHRVEVKQGKLLLDKKYMCREVRLHSLCRSMQQLIAAILP